MRKIRFWSGWTGDEWRKRYGDKVLLDFEEHCQPGFVTTKFKRLPTKIVYHCSHSRFPSVNREHKSGGSSLDFFLCYQCTYGNEGPKLWSSVLLKVNQSYVC